MREDLAITESTTIEPRDRSIDSDRKQLEEQIAGLRTEVYRFILSKTKNKDEAEELTQRAIMQAIEKLDQLEDINKLKGWLMTIAHREFLMEKRSVRRLSRQQVELHDSNSEEDGPPNIELEDEHWKDQFRDPLLRKRLNDAISHLPKKQAAVFKGLYFDGLSREEIAAQEGIDIKTVATNLFNARNSLIRLLRAKRITPDVELQV